MPVYNGAKYVEEAIRAILRQSYEELELIIADNASTDGTETICRRYEAADPRVRYIRHEENRGAAYNYNVLVHQARGEFFKWMAHDDSCEEGLIERCVAEFDRGGKATALCYPSTVEIDESGVSLGLCEDRMHLWQESPARRVAKLAANLRMCNEVFGLIRLEALRDTQLIGAYNASDRVLLLEMALRGRFVHVPGTYFYRRMHREMSHRANATDRERAAWFDPNQATRSYEEISIHRAFREQLRLTLKAPLRYDQRLSCYLAIRLGRQWRKLARL
jgi:glycosyltransferase involved in cell wall biosynthesis